MYKIGLSSCGFALNEENFKKLHESGIEAIEISRSLENLKMLNYREVYELAKRYGVLLWSFHLPFMPFAEIDISSCDRDVRGSTLELHKELISRVSDIGIDKFVIHPSGEPIAPDKREERIKYAMQSLDILAEFAHGCGSVIAVEDLPRTCLGNTADEIQRLISANDKLRVCFDTNHLLKDDNISFIEKLGEKIITLHVSDYDLVDEKHWLAGEGVVDFYEIYSMLKKVNYDGVWLYELGLKSPKTLTRSRELEFCDFVRNAEEIFGNKPITRIK